MKQLGIALALGVVLFSCTKAPELIANVKEIGVENNLHTTPIIVDFREFPAHSIYTLESTESNRKYTFDSDSLSYDRRYIVKGNYKMTWEIRGITENKKYRAKMINESQGTIVDWKPSVITMNGGYTYGTFTFTRVLK